MDPVKLKIKGLTEIRWKKILDHCRKFDVEEGETEEYAYSVRASKNSVTWWTRTGWREGWFIATITYLNNKDREILIEWGLDAPEGRRGSLRVVEELIEQLRIAARAI